ncbi:hypothetical protein A2533_03690 [Candidatus Falkowbacteria bacterium RIFOXYD2_FULL_35_9]|uniref:Uncharacterized protein n=1 Tax=Candidatus Falkowbacteria bacterium RIFOXYC2_FULL_36_12 TaxID=1798002 RepID=A0A1F5SYW0_9BACT|nr:MAG: hypothetical protein A2478_04270 [Candidatus Falkowbacteria bacterium RIFOXYC2_FULL_36_12]OGF31996.1 MAG: hypothetical protein A2300_02505 [Candidatus Falkowbacteria bacterium RIFOXYB2_FULL_35_7]OGF33812.1 MAG: hypothetical protein A2223_03775 [Candidatus Falkowbacteria bacterium RIFOXYA2_FULL_35_8]OGF45935.1 MAG: hypothetical protein A2533_03690 [Candidatus Falkowbacteria bacterium RIFOXYD2_FULL_35_9]
MVPLTSEQEQLIQNIIRHVTDAHYQTASDALARLMRSVRHNDILIREVGHRLARVSIYLSSSFASASTQGFLMRDPPTFLERKNWLKFWQDECGWLLGQEARNLIH